MPSIDRADLIHAIKDAIGRLDEDGNEIVGADETPASEPISLERRPSREKIRAIAKEMAEDEVQERRAAKA